MQDFADLPTENAVIKSLLRDEHGVSLVMAVAFLSLALPTTVGALQLAGTLSTASREDTDSLLSQYAAVGGQQAVHQAQKRAGVLIG